MPAWLIPLLIAGGTKLVDTIQQSRASGKAAEQQQAAAREALAIAGQQTAQARADLNPFAQAGVQGLTSLTTLLGLPGGLQGTNAGAMPLAGGGPQPVAQGGRTPGPDAQYTGHYAIPRGTLPNPPGTPPQYPATQSAYGGGMVLLRAPTGETQAVPAAHVDYYLARGATRAAPAATGR